jgi:putative salt-induced outer membrane protein YdiY
MRKAAAIRLRPMSGRLPRPRLRRWSGLLAAVGWIVGAPAAEVWLKDSGHLVGDLARAEGLLIVRTGSVGEVRVPLENVVRVSGESPPAPAKPPPPVQSKPPPWKFRLEAGYFSQSVNVSTRRLSLSAHAQRTAGKNDYQIDLRRLDARTGSVQVENRDDMSFRWRREVSAKLFLQEVSSYLQDGIRGIRAQFEQTLDTGYRFMQGPRVNASIGLGLVGQHRQMSILQPEGTGFLGQVFSEFGWQINERLRLTLNSRFQSLFNELGSFPNTQGVPVSGAQGRYFYQYNLGLNSKVTERITAGVSHEEIYDTTIANAALRRDQRFSFNLGLNF